LGPIEEEMIEGEVHFKVIRVGHKYWSSERASNEMGARWSGSKDMFDEVIEWIKDGCPFCIWPGGEEATHQSMVTMGELLDDEWWYEWR